MRVNALFAQFRGCRFPFLASRAPSSTVIPLRPSWRAVSSPMPLLAPVINAVFLLFINVIRLIDFVRLMGIHLAAVCR